MVVGSHHEFVLPNPRQDWQGPDSAVIRVFRDHWDEKWVYHLSVWMPHAGVSYPNRESEHASWQEAVDEAVAEIRRHIANDDSAAAARIRAWLNEVGRQPTLF